MASGGYVDSGDLISQSIGGDQEGNSLSGIGPWRMGLDEFADDKALDPVGTW